MKHVEWSAWVAYANTHQVILAEIGGGIAFGVLLFVYGRELLGKLCMRHRKKQRRLFRETLEEIFVDGLDGAIEQGKLTVEDAREAYAMIAHHGLWGLHPRKYAPPPPDEQELKERIKARLNALKAKEKETLASLLAEAIAKA